MTKHLLSPASIALCAVLLVGCRVSRDERKTRQQNTGFHPPAASSEEPTRDPSSGESSKPPKNRDRGDEPAPTFNPPPQEAPVKTGDLPYAKGVAGKPGFVTSPFAPAAGYIDVRGFPPGTEVKDPYSGKTFLVP